MAIKIVSARGKNFIRKMVRIMLLLKGLWASCGLDEERVPPGCMEAGRLRAGRLRLAEARLNTYAKRAQANIG
jgi:hypothetical protein